MARLDIVLQWQTGIYVTVADYLYNANPQFFTTFIIKAEGVTFHSRV